MKINRINKSWYTLPGILKAVGCIAAASVLLSAVPVLAETSVFGQSDTIFRMGQSLDEKDLYPVYEYLRLSAVSADKDGSATSLHIGGWARVDLADKTARDRHTDADLQYGYISFQGAKNNFLINAGRQFVIEGVGTQRLDGLYASSDFAAGFGGAVYVGSPVVTEPNLEADDFIFGGRVTHSLYKYYTVGLSALRSYEGEGLVYREEEGFDVWAHPIKQVDVTGRSAYNSVTNGWMEHAYVVSYLPVESLRITGDYSYTSYQDYFYRVTTSALSYAFGNIDRREKVTTFGGSLAYTPIKNFTVAGDYKNYNYDIARSANYFGGKIAYSLPDSLATGFSIHRMDGNTDSLNYYEYRVFASKKLSQLYLALDLFNVSYDSRINDVKNAYSVAGAATYEFNEKVKVNANVEYAHNPFFDDEVKGLFKLTYVFDTRRAAEGRTK